MRLHHRAIPYSVADHLNQSQEVHEDPSNGNTYFHLQCKLSRLEFCLFGYKAILLMVFRSLCGTTNAEEAALA